MSDDVNAWVQTIRDELEYLLTAAVKPGTISHHDAEDAEVRLRTALNCLAARADELEHENGVLTFASENRWQRMEQAEERVIKLTSGLEIIANSVFPATYLGTRDDGMKMYGGSQDASKFARKILEDA